MLRRLWRWLYGAPEPDAIAASLKVIMESQQRQQELMFNIVQQVQETSGKQAEVLASYLKLFQGPGDTAHWSPDEEEENKEELKGMGFPDNWSAMPDEDQAKWVLSNLAKL